MSLMAGCTIVIARPEPGPGTAAGEEAAPTRPSEIGEPASPLDTSTAVISATAEILATPLIIPIITSTEIAFSTLPTLWPTSTPAVTPTPVPIVYIVQPGDTLGIIAKRLGLSDPYYIAAYNHLANPNLIEVGQVLLIPQEMLKIIPTGHSVASGAVPAAVNIATSTPIIVIWTATATTTPSPTPTSSPTPSGPTATPTPTRTATPTPVPTSTFYPTYTPYPTNTAYPTATPSPSPAPTGPTAYPTNTPYPTYTPYPPPTYTPAPTYTPYPTFTPLPQPTPIVANTPTATATITPTATSTATPIN